MQSNDAETSTFLFRTAAWIWLGYLALLMGTEVYLSHVPFTSVGRFYLLNGSLGLLFLVERPVAGTAKPIEAILHAPNAGADCGPAHRV